MATSFQAGVAMRDITPTPEIINNSLHPCMTVNFKEPGSPLHTKALALRHDSLTVLIVTFDLIGMGHEHVDAVRQAVSEATGLDLDHVVLHCSHTHSSPFVEPLSGPHPFADLIRQRAVEAAREAVAALRPAKMAYGTTHVVGASFNTRLPVPGKGVKFTRDFREGLAGGRPVDPRLTVVRLDDADGKPIAGFVRFAAHPACVIFNAPVSAEYPGYMTDRLSAEFAGGAPVLFGYGCSGDANCAPMFGQEKDSKNLGLQLAGLAGPLFQSLKTRVPQRVAWHTTEVALPLDPPLSIAQLDKEIAEVEAFTKALDTDPTLEWVIGINCKKEWPVESKKNHVKGLAEWCRLVKARLERGEKFPTTWSVPLSTLVIDDLGLLFYGGEVVTQISLSMSARSPLKETLMMSFSNRSDAYIGTAEDRRAGGYETYTAFRYSLLAEGVRPLSYAEEAAERLIEACLASIAAATGGAKTAKGRRGKRAK